MRVAREKLIPVAAAVAGARRVLITSEPYPDGDAVGAEIALRQVVQSLAPGGAAGGRGGAAPEIWLVNERGCPSKFRFLEGSGRITPLEALPRGEFDVGLVVDGGCERTGAVRPLFDACRTKVYIDHHKLGSRERYDVSLTDPEMGSTAELIYGFFDEEGLSVPLTREAAEALYLGIIADTGSFSYSLTTADTHRIAARLLETGIDFSKIQERALLTQEFDEIKLLGQVLATARRSRTGDVLYAILPRDLIREFRVSGDDTDKIIKNLSFVDGVKASVLFKEIADAKYKISLRSRGEVDVAEVARSLDPGGGGHARAAGCTLTGHRDDVVERTVTRVEALLVPRSR